MLPLPRRTKSLAGLWGLFLPPLERSRARAFFFHHLPSPPHRLNADPAPSPPSSQLASTEEYIDGQFAGNLGEVLIRCVEPDRPNPKKNEKKIPCWPLEIGQAAKKKKLDFWLFLFSPCRNVCAGFQLGVATLGYIRAHTRLTKGAAPIEHPEFLPCTRSQKKSLRERRVAPVRPNQPPLSRRNPLT